MQLRRQCHLQDLSSHGVNNHVSRLPSLDHSHQVLEADARSLAQTRVHDVRVNRGELDLRTPIALGSINAAAEWNGNDFLQ